MQHIVPYIPFHFGRFPDSSRCRYLKQTDVTHGRPLPYFLIVFIFWGSGGCRSHGKGGTLKEKNFKVERETLSAGFWDPNYPVGVTVLNLFNVPAVLCMEGGYYPQIHAL